MGVERVNGPGGNTRAEAVTSTGTQPGAYQAFPAESALGIAQQGISAAPGEFASFQADLGMIDEQSYVETAEDIGFAISARSRDGRTPQREGKVDRSRTKAMLGKLAEVSEEQLSELHARVPQIEESLAPGDEMRRAGFDAGEMALLLGACLRRGGLDSAARGRLEHALSAALESDEWVLQLFSRLEFGAAGRTSFAELRQLYRRASMQRPRLSQWFDDLRSLRDRKRKLKALIRALAFELSAEAFAVGAQLAAVIGDLKRILHFFSMEDHCDRLARSLPQAELDGDGVLGLLIDTVQESWVDKQWIEDRANQLVPDDTRRYAFIHQMKEVVKLLPGDCFNDEDQQETILDAFSSCLEALAEREV